MDLEGEPLNVKRLERVNKQGQKKVVNALHIGFAEKRDYILYQKPNVAFDSVAIDEWLVMMDEIEEDLNWLLSLPYHRFWSQVTFDSNLITFLDDMLSNTPRFYHLENVLSTEEMKSSLERVQVQLFKVYLRMSTFKESKTCHITPEVYAEIIYNNYLFDIPKLMDLCILFGKGNRELLVKMIKNIFTVQQAYFNDLEKVVSTFMQILGEVEESIGLGRKEISSEPLKLNSQSSVNKLLDSNIEELTRYIMTISDTCITLGQFFEIFGQASLSYNVPSHAITIAFYYENLFQPLKKELKSRQTNENTFLIKQLRRRISLSKSNLIEAFRAILYSSCILPLGSGNSASASNSAAENVHEVKCIEDYLQIINGVLCEKSFICDYQKKYAIEEDLELFSQSPYAPDPARVAFILNTLYSVYGKLIPNNFLMPQTSESDAVDKWPAESQDYSHLEGASAYPRIDGVELDSLISSIKDLLPDYGEGFIEKCLEYYNYKSDAVINALLENNLPRELQKIDQKLDKLEKDSQLSSETDFHTEPCSVPDFSFDMPHPTYAKRVRGDSLSEDAKKNIINRYGIVEDEATYDDEYDDTYDLAPMGADENYSGEDEEDKEFNTPRVLAETKKSSNNFTNQAGNKKESNMPMMNRLSNNRRDNFPRHSVDSQDRNLQRDQGFQKDRNDSRKKPVSMDIPSYNRHDSFVQNPEEMRERAARNDSRKKFNEKGNHKSQDQSDTDIPFNRNDNFVPNPEELRERAARNDSRKNFNVKGNPKGQGQSTDVVKNRHHKEKNKAVAGNHNRKAGHDRKARTGMF